MPEENNVVVVLTTGKQDRGTRATLAFAWACTALALGKPTSVYLTMDGTVWAMTNATEGVRVEGFEPLSEYLDQFLALEGELLVCAPCSEYYCSFQHKPLDQQLHANAQVVGLSTIVGKTGPNTSLVTF